MASTKALLCFVIAFLFTFIKAQDKDDDVSSCDAAASSPQVLSNNMLSPIDPNLFHNSNTVSNVSIASIPGGESINLQYVQHFLSLEEISKVISFCDNRNGWTASPQSNGISTQVKKETRTSHSCPLMWPLLYLPQMEKIKASGRLTPQLEDEIYTAWTLMQRIAKLLDVNEGRIEPLQLIRYNPGQFYKQHHDHGSYYGKNSEQRPMTLLLFLSSVPAEDGGGHTKFDALDIAVLPQAGDGIAWQNEDLKGEPMEDALHQAVPPREDGKVIKYAMNVWVARDPIMENLEDVVSYRTKLSTDAAAET